MAASENPHIARALLTAEISAFTGYVSSVEKAQEFVKKYEFATSSKFSKVRKTAKFGNTDPMTKGHTIKKGRKIYWKMCSQKMCLNWKSNFAYDGVPFMIGGSQQMECHHGKDHKVAFKEKYHQKKLAATKNPKYQTIVPKTKKVNCPAKILMREIIKFPGYEITDDCSRYKMDTNSKKLRDDLKKGTLLRPMERRIYIQFPGPDEHKNHECVVKGRSPRKRKRSKRPKTAQVSTDLDSSVPVVTEQNVEEEDTSFVDSSIYPESPAVRPDPGQLPLPTPSSTSLQSSCRDILKQIEKLTYSMSDDNDNETLRELHSDLEIVLAKAQALVPASENEIPLNSCEEMILPNSQTLVPIENGISLSLPQQKRNIHTLDTNGSCARQWVVARKRNHPSSGQGGEKAEKIGKVIHIKFLPVDKNNVSHEVSIVSS